MPQEAWVTVATYDSVLEAEFAAATLQEAGIPAHTAGAHLGIFGPGYQGGSPRGVQVQVPHHRAEDAAELLASLEPDDADPSSPPPESEETP